MKKILLVLITVFCVLVSNAQVDNTGIALQLVNKNQAAIGLSDEEMKNIVVSDSYFDKTAGIQLVYLQQLYKGIPVFNELQVLAFKNDKLVSKSGSRIRGMEKRVNKNEGIPSISANNAVLAAMADRKLETTVQPMAISSAKNGRYIVFDAMNISRENITAELMWVPLEDGKKVVLAWQVYIIPVNSSDYWLVRVNANDRTIAGINNLTVYCNWEKPAAGEHDHACQPNNNSQTKKSSPISFFNPPAFNFGAGTDNSTAIVSSATYRVIPFPYESPSHPGGANALRTDPWTLASGDATTLKWHNNGLLDFNYTRGNNVWAQEDRNGNNGSGVPATSTTTPDPLNFNFTPLFSVTPTQTSPNQNQQFSITNLFYWNNIIHDLTYQYGFDEVAGNFQASNLGRGGLGNDFVFADAQDGGGTNNANFSTPPDGSNPRMQMYLWSGNPQKDGDLDNGVVTHEFTHGISNRLTGGPANAACLGNAENMGEGWSDYYALMYTQDWANATLNTGFNSPRGIGTYVTGEGPTGGGIRSQKYCTNFSVNNKVYAANISAESHNRGEIWCATLWDMTWNIINQVGTINPNIYNAAGTGGNSIALKLVTEGMKLQPCSPGFIDGRDAILQADQILYGGAYNCAIREAFRRRGMGAFASQGSSSSTSDQRTDFTLGDATVTLTQNVTEIPEGQNIVYTNKVTTGVCGGITNFKITDTLPANVTYVSGGTYNAGNRTVTFTVTQGAAVTEDYSFTVTVNNGTYFPTVSLFEDGVTSATVPAQWTANATTGNNWVVSTTRSFSPDKSYYSSNLDVTSDQTLTLTNPINLGATPPPLTFRHFYNTESMYDGGVLEISTNGGTNWTDMGTNIQTNGYTIAMDASTLLTGRSAWSGNSNNKFIKTKVNLTPYANQNVKIRFRFISDVGTNLEGWYLDDIAIKSQAVVEMQSNLFNASNIRVATSDTVTVILPAATCTAAAITTQPVNIAACSGGSATFTAVTAGTSPVYQWQVSTDNGATFSDVAGANSATLTINNVNVSQNNNQYHLLVSNSCPSSATSVAAILTVTEQANITGQPTNQTLCAGGNAVFSVTATGSSNIYQWQVSTDNGNTFTDITGETNSTLNLANVTPTMNSNQYHVVITSCGPTGLTSSNVTLVVNSPALFVSQPTNVSACAGSDAVFTTTVSGTTLTYQWQLSTNGGGTFGDIAGATSATLTVPAVDASMDGYQYQVIVTSSACPATITSTAAILTVSNNAAILTQPADNSVCPGSNTLFTVSATGSGLTYQWQISTDGGANFSDIAGETSATLNLNNVTLSMEGTVYRVVITSSCSTATLTSTEVVLHVLPPVQFNSQPANVGICGNADAVFTVDATGTSLTYQWQVSTNGGTTYDDIPGETNSTLTLTAVTPAQSNNIYHVVVTGVPCGAVTSDPALLTVSTPAQITTQPSDVTTCENDNAVINVATTGANLVYQWQVSTDGGINFTDITGENDNTLTLTGVASTVNNNQYQVIVTEAVCGSITSTPAILVVNPLPVVTITADPSTVLAAGGSTTLTATANPPATSFTWYRNGVEVPGQTGSTLTVNSDATGDYVAAAIGTNNCLGQSNLLTIRDTVFNYTFIYPNPNNGHFFVRFEGVPYNNLPRLITMYDSKGARVYVQSYSVTSSYQPLEVKVEKFSKGVYLLVLSDASGETLKTGKVVIQ